MSKRVNALISWVPAAKGGRKTPPAGPRFVTPVRFCDDQIAPDWSIVVDFVRLFGKGKYLFAKVSFLAPDAPHDLLQKGNRFELYEGRKVVGTGLIHGKSNVPSAAKEFEHVLLH